MTNLEARLSHLEQLAAAQADTNNRLWAAIYALQQALRITQQSGYGGNGGGGIIYQVTAANAVVIAGGGNATGVTVSVRTGSSITTVTTNGTVYNDMQTATVTGKTILLGLNADGSFLAITQSC